MVWADIHFCWRQGCLWAWRTLKESENLKNDSRFYHQGSLLCRSTCPGRHSTEQSRPRASSGRCWWRSSRIERLSWRKGRQVQRRIFCLTCCWRLMMTDSTWRNWTSPIRFLGYWLVEKQQVLPAPLLSSTLLSFLTFMKKSTMVYFPFFPISIYFSFFHFNVTKNINFLFASKKCLPLINSF